MDNLDNLLDMLNSDTRIKRVAATNGGEFAGACPFCGGSDRFRVWPYENGGRWWCRQCERSGDTIAYAVETGRIDKRDAYRLRHGDEPASVTPKTSRPAQTAKPPDPATPPNRAWQKRAWAFVASSQSQLWDTAGAKALAWLHRRGLTDATIRHAGLGYCDRDYYEDRELWGLPDGKRIWLPRGVVVPWFIGNNVWRVNIRRPVRSGEDLKVIGPAGYAQGLYEADRLRSGLPAILVEGELDALTLLQEAGDLLAAVATGGTTSGRRARWIAKLALCSVVLVAFDADDAGERARRWWLNTLPNGQYWRPYWGDANSLLQDGADIRAWIAAGIAQ